MEALNPRQAEFVRLYLQTGNGTRSYMQAYEITDEPTGRANASRMRTNANIQQAIQEHQKKMETQTGITVEQVVKRIAKLADKAEKDGDRLKALDMLMKHLGGYVTTREIIGNMTTEEVEALADRLLAKAHQSPTLPNNP